jgi:hypothetical protein
MYAKTERNKVPRGENVHQSTESMREKKHQKRRKEEVPSG